VPDESYELDKNVPGGSAVAKENLYRPINGPVFNEWMTAEPICATFLESILRRPVGKLRIAREQEIPELDILVRNIRVDILATNECFEIFNVESQNRYYRDSHNDRNLLHTCRLISTQLRKGQDFGELRPTTVIFINLRNPDGHDFVDSASIKYDNPKHGEYNKKLKIIEFNLDHHSEATEDIPKALRVFSLFCMYGDKEETFKNACKAEGLNEHDLIQMLLDRLKEIRRDEEIKKDLDNYFKEHQYIEEVSPVSVLETVRIEGRTEGRIEGAIFGKIEDALSGLEIGFAKEGIAKQTKLPLEFIEMLAEAIGEVSAENAYAKYVEMYSTGE
jgi:predicted transposase/invertase (TIGR01784 family)